MDAVTDRRPRAGSRPIRVLHLIKGLGRGGAEMLLADGPRLSDPAELRYAFGYFVPWKDALAGELAERIGPVVCFDAPSAASMLARVPGVARVIRDLDADLVHCHMPLASVVGRLAGRIAHVPVISTEHNVLERYHPATRVATLATWGMQAHVIAVSQEVARSIARHGRSRVPVTVVPNGVSLERFPGPGDPVLARREVGLPELSPVVGTIAVFRSQKRLDLWLAAAARIARSLPEARFLLVGDGPLRGVVEREIERLGLGERVTLTGLQADVRPFLRAMDVYMVSSDFEGLPVALLEAMATGIVPVSTAVGGIGEVISKGPGVLVPRGDVEGLSRGVLQILGQSPALRQQMSARARARVEAEFGTDRMMRRIEAVYREVLGRD